VTFHPVNRHSDKLHGISLGGIEPGRELVDIPVQMSFAHVVVDAVVPAFQ